MLRDRKTKEMSGGARERGSEGARRPIGLFLSLALSLVLSVAFSVLATTAVQAAPAPVLFFTDLIYGPNTGGESVNGYSGAYVTLYGNFFGSSQGNSSVTWNGQNCLRVVNWGTPWLWYQKTVVQLGSGCTAGTGNFVVTAGGQASNGAPFTVGSGHIYFVSTTGSDGNNGSFAAPWQTIPHAVQTAGTSAGNVIYGLSGVQANVEDGEGWGAALTMRPAWSAGTAAAPNGLINYPGATVQIGCTGSTCPPYGIRCTDTDAWTAADRGYWTFAGITFRSSVSGGPLAIAGGSPPGPSGLESRGWRLIANDVSSPNGNDNSQTPFQIQSAAFVKVFGNYLHDLVLLTTSRLAQAMYLSTDANNQELGWNEIYNNKGRGGLQTHSSNLCYPSCSGDRTGFILHDISIHDNKIHHINEEGILVDTVDPSQGSGVRVYNNVIYDSGLDGGGDTLHFQLSGDFTQAGNLGHSPAPVWYYNNTVYTTNGEASFGNWWPDVHSGGQNVTARAANNLFVTASAGTPYLHIENYSGSGCSNSDAPSQCGTMSGNKNLMVGSGAPTFSNLFTNSLNANPLFVSPSAFDFHLQSISPAMGAGLQTIQDVTGNYSVSAPVYDIDGRIRPNPPSMGAYEYNTGTPSPPPAPVITSAITSTGTVGSAYIYQITATNSPTSYSATGLPGGLAVNTVTGLISGTPTTAGTSNASLIAINASGTGTATLTLTVYFACDLNHDNSANVIDVQLEVNMALGVKPCTGDIHKDAVCNVIDVQRVVNAALGGQCVTQ